MSVYVKGTDNISTLVALTIRIEKIGLKDASQFIDPYISVYIKGTEYRWYNINLRNTNYSYKEISGGSRGGSSEPHSRSSVFKYPMKMK